MMHPDNQSTILHYRKNAIELVSRYESADVTRLQMDLRDSMDRRSKVLELGCGSGRDAAFLKRYGNVGELTVTDASPEMLREAKRLHPELAVNLKELILPRGLEPLIRKGTRFTGIYSIASLMHLSSADIEDTLQQLAMITEQGGIFFLSVCTEREKPADDDDRVFTIKPPKWWKKQLENAGFKTVDMRITPDGLARKNTSWLNITAML